MSWFGFGGNQTKNSTGGSSANNNNPVFVEGILDKIPTTKDLDEKRELVNKLSSIGRNCHQIVGSKMSILTNTLKENKEDIELVREIIEILTLIMTTIQKDDNIVEVHNTDLFISDVDNFNLICDLLLINDYYVRYYISRFLNIIIKNRFEAVQDVILKCPIAMTNIMSLLMDGREMIRNESILIISDLTRSNQEIQKMVAFGNGFEILLDIIAKEGHSDGGVVVLDSLQVLINLLKGNVLNQNYFRETGCISRLAPLLQVHNKDMWILSDQKFNIIMICLDLILSLVERNNLSTLQNQLIISKSGIMNLIIRLALGKMSSIIIKSKSLFILGEILYMNNENINEFSSVSIKSEVTKQSQSALFRLTMVMLYNKDLLEKSSAFHVFKCYLLNNEEEQLALASTIIQNQQPPLPPPQQQKTTSPSNLHLTPSQLQQQQQQEELENYSIGQHLIKSLFSFEQPLPGKLFEMSGFWYSSLILIYMFKDSIHTKEQVLKMPLEIPKQASQVPLTLFSKLMNTLLASKTKEMDSMIKIALLKVLATWLCQSPKTIKQFFDSQLNLSFIVENILLPSSGSLNTHIQGLCTLILGICVQYMDDETADSNRSNLNTIINHRIGLNAFKDKLDVIRKSDIFTQSEQGENEFSSSAEKIQLHIYDFEFTLFFKDIYDKVRNIGVNVNKPRPGIRVNTNSSSNSNVTSGTNSPSGLQSLSPTTQPKHLHTSTTPTTPLQANVIQIQQQPIQPPPQQPPQINPVNIELEKENTQLKLQNQELLNSMNQLKLQLNQAEQLCNDNQRITDLLNDSNSKLQDFVADRDEIIEDLKEKNQYLQNKLTTLASTPTQSNDHMNSNNGFGNSDSSIDFFEVIKLRQDISELQNQVSNQSNTIQYLQNDNTLLVEQKEELSKKLTLSPPKSPTPGLNNNNNNSSNIRGGPTSPSILELKLARVEGELNELKVRYAALQKEQDDLYTYSLSLESQLNDKK